MATKVKEIIKLLEDDGWYFKRQNGSHQIYRHPTKTGIAVVPNHGLNKELKEGKVQSILKQAGLKRLTAPTIMQYVVIIEATEEGGYSAYVPDLPVCFTVGDTLDAVKTNIKEAIELYLDEARDTGIVVPMPKTMSALVEVQVA